MRTPVVLVTGAGGEIGHGLIARLASAGRPIVTIDIAPLDSHLARHVRREFVGSITDRGLLERVLAESPQVVEGVPATRAALALARRYGVTMPIVEQAHAVLFEGRDPRDAMIELMARDPTAEHWGRVP